MPLKVERQSNGFFYVTGTVTVWKGGVAYSEYIRRSTKTRDEAQADAIRFQIEHAAREQSITGRKPALSFEEAAKRYVRNGGEERFLSKPIEHLGNVRIDELTQEDIDDAGVKCYPNPATRRRQFHSPIIAVLRDNGLRPAIKRPPDGNQRTFFVRPDDAVRIIAAIQDTRYPNPWSPALATFLFGQGTRLGEALEIDGKHDISLSDKYVVLRDTKNGKERTVPLAPRVISALTTLPNLGHRGPLFLRYDGRPYDTGADRGYKMKFWKRAVTQAMGDGRYTPHTARHSWATWFYSHTKDVVALKAYGGWESSEWERYVKHAIPAMGQRAVELGFLIPKENESSSNFAMISR